MGEVTGGEIGQASSTGETWRAVEIREDGSRRVLLEGIPAVDRHEIAEFCGWLGEVDGRVRVEREGRP